VGAGSAAVAADCFDRSTQPYTSQVDGHLHFRPFGGKAIPFDEVVSYLRKSGVHYANVFGIGQKLPADSGCTYYLDCPGTPVLPSIKNDVVNGENYLESRPTDPHLTLSMTSFDVAHPETIPADLAMYDEEFPGQFRWGGELNVVKAALFHNHHEPATPQDIDQWANFMTVLKKRNIPLTLHSELGTDQQPTKSCIYWTACLTATRATRSCGRTWACRRSSPRWTHAFTSTSPNASSTSTRT
jgi:hypothetical protein